MRKESVWEAPLQRLRFVLPCGRVRAASPDPRIVAIHTGLLP